MNAESTQEQHQHASGRLQHHSDKDKKHQHHHHEMNRHLSAAQRGRIIEKVLLVTGCLLVIVISIAIFFAYFIDR